MKSANVYRNGERVGVLIRYERNSYEFEYDDQWFNNPEKPAVSLTMPKTKKTYKADHLFPFFYNLLSEGVNRKLQSRQLKIDEKNYFDLLLATAQTDTIGAITLKSKNK
ncbi:phosphatidylinositol kinase [Rhodohalobacter sp. SW132]|uniref:HipA N-terminal domain-containing protein n=1 Tax=Rhodohalobacter sp. SW132 TaxID=2293433 RepID=UPI000E27FE8A|nr:HipA N-terminal domain-containing protein [Rhodohalobacter sp. SW132]REL24820.1 phosphatidylinositol kinase [Rhodohalobacter sp. SW132]